MTDSLGAVGLYKAWDERVHDARPRVRLGYSALDQDLHRGGLAPGELAILGGRTHTRKTSFALNAMANMLNAGVKVGFVALDETVAGYTSKLTSVLTGLPMEYLEDQWEETQEQRAAAQATLYGNLVATTRTRPSFEFLTSWLETSQVDLGARPQVVFIDYLSLLERAQFAGAEVQRVQRLVEDLQVWTAENQVVTIALHQVGRTAEREGRYHGDTPLSLESLKFGGEEIADVVWGTYRPALDPLGNMTFEEAKAVLGDKFDDEKWEDARNRVTQYRDVTLVQLLKNRPGVRLNYQGVMLRSPNDSLVMQPAAGATGEDRKVVALSGNRV